MKNRVLMNAFLGTVLFLGSAACTKDSDNVTVSDGRMTFSSDLLSTRTVDLDVQSTQIAEGAQVGVSVLSGGDAWYVNSCIQADGNGGFAAVGEEMYWPGENAEVYAYAPFNAGWTDITAPADFTVAADQSTDAGYLASDLLIGAPEVNPVAQTEETVSLKFSHKLSKLNVKIMNSNDGITLQGASLSVLNVLPTVSVDLKTGELGAASGVAGNIRMALFEADASEFQASALVVPQTVASGDFLQIATSDGRAFNASLASSVDLKSNKRYTYTLRITGGSADDASVELIFGSTVDDWEDDTELGGDASEVITYEVGDYVLADGTFVKAGDVADMTAAQKSNIAGVIFSTTVSEADAAAGYSGYAMSVWGRKGAQTWSSVSEQVLVGEAASSTSEASADLDGLSFASLVKTADPEYSFYTAFNFTNYSSQRKALSGENLSGWFVPSFGQMALILNNLAGAEMDLTADYTLTGAGEYADETHPEIVDRLNSYITAVNDATYADFATSDQFFATTTERDASLIWGIKLTSTGYVIASKASKGNGGRNIAPVFAYRLPVE